MTFAIFHFLFVVGLVIVVASVATFVAAAINRTDFAALPAAITLSGWIAVLIVFVS